MGRENHPQKYPWGAAAISKKNSSIAGMLMGSLLIMLPLIIICFMGLSTLFFCIRNYDLAQSICIHHALKAQHQMKKKLNLLLKLNPRAKRLRKLYQKLQALYIKALIRGQVPLAAGLKIQIGLVQQQRIALDLKQKNLLSSSLHSTEKIFQLFKKNIRPLAAHEIKKRHYSPYPLAVKAFPLGDIAPSYKRVFRFSAQQKFKLLWKMPLYYSMPSWLKQVFFDNSLSAYQCASSLYKRRGQWIVQLSP